MYKSYFLIVVVYDTRYVTMYLHIVLSDPLQQIFGLCSIWQHIRGLCDSQPSHGGKDSAGRIFMLTTYIFLCSQIPRYVLWLSLLVGLTQYVIIEQQQGRVELGCLS